LSRRRKTEGSNTYRFFVAPEALRGDEVVLADEALARQLAQVLRLAPGDQITLLDGAGMRYRVEISALTRAGLRGRILDRAEEHGEARAHVTLYQALARAERFELVLQKATELGVAAIVPLASERSSVEASEAGRKYERWGRIVREAAEQSRRARLPTLEAALLFEEACARAAEAELALLLWEGEAEALGAVLRRQLAAGTGPPARAAILSGPEGGWSAREVAVAREHGIVPVSLGPRTLRAETAPLVALSLVLYEFGDLD
jgi:16S rRNA (uracil1498-N3)-methyltransferase